MPGTQLASILSVAMGGLLAPSSSRIAALTQPARFEETTDRGVLRARTTEGSAWVSQRELVLDVRQGAKRARFRLTAVGAAGAGALDAVDPLAGRVHILRGARPEEWGRDLRTFARAGWSEVWPEVDWLFTPTAAGLEYDVVLGPGASPRDLVIRLDGAHSLLAAPDGSLQAWSENGVVLHQEPPVVFEFGPAGHRRIGGCFEVLASDRFALRIDPPSPGALVVVDPEILFSNFLGGSGDDEATAVATWVDPGRKAFTFVAGRTDSVDFAVTAGAYQTNKQVGTEAFAAKYDDSGSLIWATYLGGEGFDGATGIAVESTGDVVLVGSTNSPTSSGSPFPWTVPPASSGDYQGFVFKLSEDGASRRFATALAGAGRDVATSVSIGATDDIFVAGHTDSADFVPVPTGTFDVTPPTSGVPKGFVVRLRADGTPIYSTFLGDSVQPTQLTGISHHGNEARVAGWTEAGSLAGASCPAPMQRAAFRARLDDLGTQVLAANCLGGAPGEGDSEATGIATDAAGNDHLVGWTLAPSFPVAGGLRTDYRGEGDGFLAKLRPDASTEWSTFLGGEFSPCGSPCLPQEAEDPALGVAVHRSSGRVYVVGKSRVIFPEVKAIQPLLLRRGSGTAYLSAIDDSGGELLLSTSYGYRSQANAVALDLAGNPSLAGVVTGGPGIESWIPTVRTTWDFVGMGATQGFAGRIHLLDVAVTSRPRDPDFGQSLAIDITLLNDQAAEVSLGPVPPPPIPTFPFADYPILRLGPCIDPSSADSATVTNARIVGRVNQDVFLELVDPTLSPGERQVITVDQLRVSTGASPGLCCSEEIAYQTLPNGLTVTSKSCIEVGLCPSSSRPPGARDLRAARAGTTLLLRWSRPDPTDTTTTEYRAYGVVNGCRDLIPYADESGTRQFDREVQLACAVSPLPATGDPECSLSWPAEPLVFYQVRGACGGLEGIETPPVPSASGACLP